MRLILILSMIFIFSNCKEKTVEPSSTFSFSTMKGNWFPYESVDNNGNINKNSLLSMNTFGVYAGGFQIEENGVYYPISGVDFLNFVIKTEEKGLAKYSSKENKITFDGIWKVELEIVKFESNELWLKESGTNGSSILKMVRK
jgi:hypothetical protein